MLAKTRVKTVLHAAPRVQIIRPDVLAVSQRFEEESLLLGLTVRPWEEILVEELEAQMLPKPSNEFFMWEESLRTVVKKRQQDFFVYGQATIPRASYMKDLIKDAVTYSIRDAQATKEIFDIGVDWADLECRMLAATCASPGELLFHNLKDRSDSCRPTFKVPPQQSFLPISSSSRAVSNSLGRTGSVIPRLLGDWASKSPPSTVE